MDWAERTHVVPWLGLLEAESEVSTSIQTATTGHNEAMNLSPYLEGRLLSDGASPSAYVPPACCGAGQAGRQCKSMGRMEICRPASSALD